MTQSVRHRLTLSLVATVLRSGMSFVAGLAIARTLGPDQYGVMVFLLGTAAATRQLFDMGTSTAFFTFLAQRERSRKFNRLYFRWLALQLIVPALAILLILPDELVGTLWRGQPRLVVTLAFCASFAQMVLWSTANQMGEARRLTRLGQTIAGAAALLHLIFAGVAWWTGWISVNAVLIAITVEWVVATLVMAKWLGAADGVRGDDTARSVAGEFMRFCGPLVPYAAAGFLYEFADRWLLQTYGGSAEQGYYAAALQFGAVAALANAAITNVFWKEVAEAHYQRRSDAVSRLHRRMSRGLFFVASAIAGFLIPWANELVALTLGPAYRDGAVTFAVMLLYPIHQTQGQINGTTAFATQSLAGYTTIASLSMLASVGFTYFAVAPASAAVPGLGMASLGVALKMVLVQVITVNVISYYLARRLHIAFDWIYQPIVVVAAVGSGAVARMVATAAMGSDGPEWLAAPVALVLYGGMIGSLFVVWPSLAGASRGDVQTLGRLAGIGKP